MSTLTFEEAQQFRVGPNFQIEDVDPAATPGVSDVDTAFHAFDQELDSLQECLHANGRAGNEKAGSVLLVLQGMDTSGKGGIIRHVIGETMDLQGVHVHAFGRPTEEEAAHDFLWRITLMIFVPFAASSFSKSTIAP